MATIKEIKKAGNVLYDFTACVGRDTSGKQIRRYLRHAKPQNGQPLSGKIQSGRNTLPNRQPQRLGRHITYPPKSGGMTSWAILIMYGSP